MVNGKQDFAFIAHLFHCGNLLGGIQKKTIIGSTGDIGYWITTIVKALLIGAYQTADFPVGR